MATNHTLSLCVDPKYVFQSFDNLGNCYDAVGDTLSSNFTNVAETCLNDYCKNPYPDLGGCGNWNGTASLPFVGQYHTGQPILLEQCHLHRGQ